MRPTTLLAVAPRSDRWQPSRHDRSHQLNGHQHFAMCPGGKLAGTVPTKRETFVPQADPLAGPSHRNLTGAGGQRHRR